MDFNKVQSKSYEKANRHASAHFQEKFGTFTDSGNPTNPVNSDSVSCS